jgi:hypothetical protein
LAGHPIAPTKPARRRKDRPSRDRNARSQRSLWRMSQGLGDPTLRVTADARDRVMTPNALSCASRPEAPGGKPQGRADVADCINAGIRPRRHSVDTTAPAVRNVEAVGTRTLATPGQRSAAGESLKGTKSSRGVTAWRRKQHKRNAQS